MEIKIPNVTIDPNLQNKINREITVILVQELNLILREILQNRQRGISANGSNFQQYSASYAKAIRKGLIRLKGSTIPNMTQTGNFNRSSLVQPINQSSVGIKYNSSKMLQRHDWLEDMGYGPLLFLKPEHKKRIFLKIKEIFRNNYKNFLKIN